MKDGAMKACVGMVCVVGLYGIYAFSHPQADGAAFGTVALIVGGLAGYSVGVKSAQKA